VHRRLNAPSGRMYRMEVTFCVPPTASCCADEQSCESESFHLYSLSIYRVAMRPRAGSTDPAYPPHARPSQHAMPSAGAQRRSPTQLVGATHRCAPRCDALPGASVWTEMPISVSKLVTFGRLRQILLDQLLYEWPVLERDILLHIRALVGLSFCNLLPGSWRGLSCILECLRLTR